MKAYINKNNLNGEIIVPGSKSHTIRAISIAAMANGKSIIRNPLPSADCTATMEAVRLFGAKTEYLEEYWTVEGRGKDLLIPENVVDIKNSGTALYFMIAMASLLDDYTVVTGDEQIVKRPVRHLLEALNELGAESFNTRTAIDAPPIVIKGPIKPGTCTLDGTLSQYVSAVLLAAANVDGDVTIKVEDPKEVPYVQMTIDWMEKTGINVDYDKDEFKWFSVKGNQEYKAFDLTVPSDWSGVAFPICAAAITDSVVTINGLSLKDTQGDAKIVDILLEMGADIRINEEEGSLTVYGGKPLEGVTVNLSNMPDSLPMLSVVAAYANGKTTFEGVGIARAKETDRVKVMKEGLSKMGVKVEDDFDTMTVYHAEKLQGCELESYHDHRIAMALSVAGLIAEGETIVNDADCVKISFPEFYQAMNNMGAGFRLEK